MNSSADCTLQLRNFTAIIGERLKPDVLPAHLAVCVLSSVVSAINIAVLTRPGMISSSTNLHLATLELSNLIVALFSIPPAVMLHSFPASTVRVEGVVVLYVFMEIAWTAYHFSCWSSLFVGVWRFVAITWPLKAKIILTTRRTKLVIAGLTVLCIAASAYDYWDLTRRINERKYICNDDDLRLLYSGFIVSSNEDSMLSQILLYCVPFELIPMVISLVVVWLLLRKITLLGKRCVSVSHCSFRKTYMLIILVFGFLVANVLHLTPFLLMYAHVREWNHDWKFVLVTALPTIAFNTLTFALYYFMSCKFRKSFWEMFRCFS